MSLELSQIGGHNKETGKYIQDRLDLVPPGEQTGRKKRISPKPPAAKAMPKVTKKAPPVVRKPVASPWGPMPR